MALNKVFAKCYVIDIQLSVIPRKLGRKFINTVANKLNQSYC
jgi:pentose-5-phosphate-3-epimerase